MTTKCNPSRIIVALLSMWALAVAGCDGGQAAEPAVADEVPGTVKVEPGGTKFDPAVLPARIPGGAWICDMPTVHYAAMEPGDGKCPLCGMTLRHVPVEPAGHEGYEGHMGGEGHEGHSGPR